MGDLAEKMEKLNIDKSSWQLTKLGDLANEISERVANPSESDYDRFVGLGNFISGDLKIKSWEPTDDLASSAKAFQTGDILFARRNAYLRRASMVDFDGCCSGDAFVLRENDNKVVPGFLAFVVNSNALWDFANSNAAGTMSKRVKWRDLSEYQFLLPPKDQQAQLAKLLWAMDEVIEREKLTKENLQSTLESRIEFEIHGLSLKGKSIGDVLKELSQQKELVKLSELGQLLKGKGIPKSAVVENGIPCVRYGELYTKHDRIIRKFHSFISEDIKSTSQLLEKNDVLFAGSGETITEIGKSAAFIDSFEAYAGSDTLLFRPHNMNGRYLGYLMNSQLVRQQLNKYGTGATVMHIYNSDLAKIKVPKIDLEHQVEIANQLDSIYKNILSIESKISSSQALQKSLINQIFS